MNRPLQRVFRIVTWLAWVGFACRALTPLGYMPAAVGEGGPFILCPSGSQAELVQFLNSRGEDAHHGGHHHGTGHSAGGVDHDEHQDGAQCPIGASFAVAVPAALLDLDVLAPPVPPPVFPVDAPVATAATARYHSRAPPSLRSA